MIPARWNLYRSARSCHATDGAPSAAESRLRLQSCPRVGIRKAAENERRGKRLPVEPLAFFVVRAESSEMVNSPGRNAVSDLCNDSATAAAHELDVASLRTSIIVSAFITRAAR